METKQHARNLAVNYANEMPSIAPSERAEVIDAYQSGYLKAIEETNVAISKAQQAIKKATL